MRAGLQANDLSGGIQLGAKHLNTAIDAIITDQLRAGLFHRLVEHDFHLLDIRNIDQIDHRSQHIARIVVIGIAAIGGNHIASRGSVRDAGNGNNIIRPAQMLRRGQLHQVAGSAHFSGEYLHCRSDLVVAGVGGCYRIDRLTKIYIQFRRRKQICQSDGWRCDIVTFSRERIGKSRAGGYFIRRKCQVGDVANGQRVSLAQLMLTGSQMYGSTIALQRCTGDEDAVIDCIVSGVFCRSRLDDFAKSDLNSS